MIFFHQSRFHFDAFSFPLCAYNLFVTFGNKIYIEFNYIKMYIRYEIVPICPYHFVHTILSGHRCKDLQLLMHLCVLLCCFSIADAFRNCTTSMADFKELIPEFYDSDGSFLQNQLMINFGVRQNGHVIGDVVLPPWADRSK